MGIDYDRRITVNFPSVEEADEVKRQAKENGMSPSQWIIYQLAVVKDFQAKFTVSYPESATNGS
jgi:hypothetical protein